MSIFSRYPYTDFHRLNADWILDKVKEAADTAETAAAEVQTWDDRISEAQTQAAQAQTAAAAAVSTSNEALQTAEGIADTADRALSRSETALTTAESARTSAAAAVNTANTANTTANRAAANAQTAIVTANGAVTTAQAASNAASAAVNIANEAASTAASAANAAQAAQTQAAAAAAAVDSKSKVYRFTVSHPRLASPDGVTLDSTEWSTPFQDLLYALEDEKTIPVLTVRYETGTQGIYSPVVQVVPTIEHKDQDYIMLSWFNAPESGDDPFNNILVVNAAKETATYYEFRVAYQSYVDERITANAPLLVQFTGSDDDGNAACNRTFSEVRYAMVNNRAVRMVCVVGQMQYDLIPVRSTGSSQSVGGHMISVGAITSTGELDAYITINCSISATDRVSVQIVDNM